MTNVFEEFKSDHYGALPILFISDRKKVLPAPFKIIKDWLGHDFRNIEDISHIYVDSNEHTKKASGLQEEEFLRRFIRLRNANAELATRDIIF